MRKRTVGTIYLVIGIFLSILNPIITVSNGIGYSIGQFSHWDPLAYWIMWFWQQCVLMIVLAIMGVYFVIFGYRSRKYYPKATSPNNERRTDPD